MLRQEDHEFKTSLDNLVSSWPIVWSNQSLLDLREIPISKKKVDNTQERTPEGVFLMDGYTHTITHTRARASMHARTHSYR